MPMTDRRRFLTMLTAAACGASSGIRTSNVFGTSLEPSLPRPCPPTAWKKLGTILAGGEQPLQNFTCPAESLGNGRWKIWYSQSGSRNALNVGFAEGRPGEALSRQLAVLSPGEPADAPLAIGNLPPEWRPVQVVYLRLRNGRHRIYFWAHGPGVVRYLAAESEDGRRYRVLDPSHPCLYHPHDRAVDGKTAAEAGLRRLVGKAPGRPAGESPAPARLVSNDATNVYQLDDGTFEMYSVALVEVGQDDPRYVAHDNAAGWLRVIDRYVSADGLEWTDRRRVIERDTRDPTDLQFYYLAVTHTPQGRIGLLGHYRVEAQTMDLEWCFSADGITWQRPERQAWLPRGQPGEADCYGIYASHALVCAEGGWHLFYTATNASHNHKQSYGRPTQVVMHAITDNPWA